jgi:hypothetical protein
MMKLKELRFYHKEKWHKQCCPHCPVPPSIIGYNEKIIHFNVVFLIIVLVQFQHVVMYFKFDNQADHVQQIKTSFGVGLPCM